MPSNAILETKKGVYPVIISEYETVLGGFPRFTGRIIGGDMASHRVPDCKTMNIEKVIFNDPATVVIWADGSKTVVKCQPGDTYSKETGLALCIAKKALGNKGNFNEVFKKWIPEDTESDKKSIRGFKVGDKVQIIDTGEHYSTYIDWVAENVTDQYDAIRWSKGWGLRLNMTGVIKYIAPREDTDDMIAYVDVGDLCYMIGFNGLEKV